MPSATGMNSPGGMRPCVGVLPAQQRLDALDPLAVQGELRLVVQEQLVVGLQRAAQVAEHGQPGGRGDVLLGLEDDGAGLELLGRVHRDVGVARAAPRLSVPCHGESAMPMLASTSRATPSTSKGSVQRLAQPLGDRARASATPSTRRQQDGELVAAQPGDGVAVAQHRPQPRADLAEQLVAVGVPEGVVDLLEAVEVDEQQRDLAVGAGRRRPAPAPRRSRSSTQLGSPVSASWVAWWRSRSAEATQLLGLPAQPLRRRGDEPEDDGVEDGEAERRG